MRKQRHDSNLRLQTDPVGICGIYPITGGMAVALRMAQAQIVSAVDYIDGEGVS